MKHGKRVLMLMGVVLQLRRMMVLHPLHMLMTQQQTH